MRFTHHTPLTILGLCALLVLSGCQHQKNAIRELEQENRALEDALYQMKFQTESACRHAARTEESNQRLRAQLENSNGASDFNRLRESIQEFNAPTLSTTPVMTPTVAPSGNTIRLTPSVRPTSGEILDTSNTPNNSNIPNPLNSPNASNAPNTPNNPSSHSAVYSAVVPVSASLPVGEVPTVTQTPQSAISRYSVEQIVIHPKMTTIWRSGQSGGFRVFVEPRDAMGRTQQIEGEITVSLIDPEIPTTQGYCGLWNISSQQVATRWTHTEAGDGWLFEFPLNPLPLHQNLTLFVRFTDQNGRRLETRQTLTLPDAPSQTTGVPIGAGTLRDAAYVYPSSSFTAYTPTLGTTAPTATTNVPTTNVPGIANAAGVTTTNVGAIPRRNIALQKQANAR